MVTNLYMESQYNMPSFPDHVPDIYHSIPDGPKAFSYVNMCVSV